MAPKAEKKPAKKVAKTAKTGSKKKSRVKVESFKIYIYKVLKQVRRPGCCACVYQGALVLSVVMQPSNSCSPWCTLLGALGYGVLC